MLQNIAHQRSEEAQELRGLFEKQLKQLYWTADTMKFMLAYTIENCTSKDLAENIEKHRIETLTHLARLIKIFKLIGIEPQPMPYDTMECLVKEAYDIKTTAKTGVVRDAAIIAILQKIKHYEIACYGTMRAYAIALREEDTVVLLEQTLEEVKLADLALSHIAESHINIEAADKEI